MKEAASKPKRMNGGHHLIEEENLFSNTRWMTDSHHDLERGVSLCREMLGSALSVQALAGL